MEHSGIRRPAGSPIMNGLVGLAAALWLASAVLGSATGQTNRPDATLPAVSAIELPASNDGSGTAFDGPQAPSSADASEWPAPEPVAAPQPYYPANQGFLGAPSKLTLQPGQIINRYGGTPVSRFFSPAGTPLAARALPPETATQALRTFEVLKPVEVEAGTVAPAFGQPGLGAQYRTSLPLAELLEEGYVREIGP